MQSGIDFGYPWYFVWGHLVIVAILLPLLLLGVARRWRRVPLTLISIGLVWAVGAFFVARFAINMNGAMTLPTQAFLSSGNGRVLDLGAGSGRSAIMVLQARPQATLVALDEFGLSYTQHFERDGEDAGPRLLLSNLRAAGVDSRATVQRGDMRKTPFPDASFDAVLSTYAIDHLNRAGIVMALAEASRVMKPRGDLLVAFLNKDAWTRFAYGPLFLHSGTRKLEGWRKLLGDAGFDVAEHGTSPLTLWILAKKR